MSTIFLKKIKDKNVVTLIFTTIPDNYENSICVLNMYNDSTASISELWVKEDLRNKGLGSLLLKEAIRLAVFHKIKKIELDNMTGNGEKLPSTIYERVGFKYVEKPFPEMYLDLSE
jgi:GNAT superfamily N-acetyltransferase